MIILDTDILIEIIRKNQIIIEKCGELGRDNLAISSISYVEFLVGSRDKKEFRKNRQFLSLFIKIPVDENIDTTLTDIFENYSLSHKPSVPDMLIAATTIHYSAPLFTLNKKDFRYLSNLILI